MSNYHGRVMNIPSDVEGMSNPSRVIYKTGHRDARHAAAEIAAEADGLVEDLCEALDDILAWHDALADPLWRGSPSQTEAIAALAKARGEKP